MAATQTIPSVQKVISVMEYIADQSDPVSVKELVYALSIPPATCYRLVNTLLKEHWLREDPAGGMRIAFGLAHVARSYSEIETRLRQLTIPLRRLAEALQLSIKITLREGNDAVTALRAEPQRPNAITSPIGYHFHLTIGSAAAALLSSLSNPEIEVIVASAPDEVWERQTAEDVWQRVEACRQAGICYDMGLSHPSIYAVSVPFTLTGIETAALTAVGWPDDFQEGRKKEISNVLKTARLSMEHA